MLFNITVVHNNSQEAGTFIFRKYILWKDKKMFSFFRFFYILLKKKITKLVNGQK